MEEWAGASGLEAWGDDGAACSTVRDEEFKEGDAVLQMLEEDAKFHRPHTEMDDGYGEAAHDPFRRADERVKRDPKAYFGARSYPTDKEWMVKMFPGWTSPRSSEPSVAKPHEGRARGGSRSESLPGRPEDTRPALVPPEQHRLNMHDLEPTPPQAARKRHPGAPGRSDRSDLGGSSDLGRSGLMSQSRGAWSPREEADEAGVQLPALLEKELRLSCAQGLSRMVQAPVRNLGSRPLRVQAAIALGAGLEAGELMVTPSELAVPAYGEQSLSIVFAPRSSNAESVSRLTLSMSGTRHVCVLRTAAERPEWVQADRPIVNFGGVPLGGSQWQTLTLTNPQDEPVHIALRGVVERDRGDGADPDDDMDVFSGECAMAFRAWIEAGPSLDREGASALLQPREAVQICVEFRPHYRVQHRAALQISCTKVRLGSQPLERALAFPVLGLGGCAQVELETREVRMRASSRDARTGWYRETIHLRNAGDRTAYVAGGAPQAQGVHLSPDFCEVPPGATVAMDVLSRGPRGRGGQHVALVWGDNMLRKRRSAARRRRGLAALDPNATPPRRDQSFLDALDEPSGLSPYKSPERLDFEHFYDEELFERNQREAEVLLTWAPDLVPGAATPARVPSPRASQQAIISPPSSAEDPVAGRWVSGTRGGTFAGAKEVRLELPHARAEHLAGSLALRNPTGAAVDLVCGLADGADSRLEVAQSRVALRPKEARAGTLDVTFRAGPSPSRDALPWDKEVVLRHGNVVEFVKVLSPLFFAYQSERSNERQPALQLAGEIAFERPPPKKASSAFVLLVNRSHKDMPVTLRVDEPRAPGQRPAFHVRARYKEVVSSARSKMRVELAFAPRTGGPHTGVLLAHWKGAALARVKLAGP